MGTPDILALLGGDEPSAAEQQQALAQALRRKQQLGMLATMSGGRLAPVGAAMRDSADLDERTAARAAQERQQHLVSLLNFAQKRGEDERDFAYRKTHDAEAAQLRREGIEATNNNAAATRSIALATLGLARRAADRADDDEARKKKKAEEGQQLPATSVEGITDLPVAMQQVDDLVALHKQLGMGGMAGKLGSTYTDLTGSGSTDAARYNAAAKLVMQAAGKIMEGGKLAAGDEIKYQAMLPRAGDSDEVVAQKAQGMKEFLTSLAQSRVKGLKAGGFKVSPELEGIVGQQATPAPVGGMVRMTNGSETFEVPAEHVADAEKDGFRRLP